MRKEAQRQILYLTLFAIAMGFLEAVVVFYIRRLYYPAGFGFPLQILPTDIIVMEWFRELATIIMLFSVAYVAGKHITERFSIFLYLFGVWDIFYYVWLKAMLNWPPSFFTWDMLFLIPVTWIGPVLAPVILSITMIIFALYVLNLEHPPHLQKRELEFIISGAFIVVVTFIWDYSVILFKSGSININVLIAQHIPVYYNWPLFILGEASILYGMWHYYRRA